MTSRPLCCRSVVSRHTTSTW